MLTTTWPPCGGIRTEAGLRPDDPGHVAATRRRRFDVPGHRHRVAVTPALRESYVEQRNAQSTYSSKACSVPRYKGVIGQGTVSQVLIRVGIAPTTNDAPATPRRPLDDVLQLTSPD